MDQIRFCNLSKPNLYQNNKKMFAGIESTIIINLIINIRILYSHILTYRVMQIAVGTLNSFGETHELRVIANKKVFFNILHHLVIKVNLAF